MKLHISYPSILIGGVYKHLFFAYANGELLLLVWVCVDLLYSCIVCVGPLPLTEKPHSCVLFPNSAWIIQQHQWYVFILYIMELILDNIMITYCGIAVLWS